MKPDTFIKLQVSITAKVTLFLQFLVLFLLPFGRLSELPVLILAVMGLAVVIQHKDQLLQSQTIKTYSICFLLYFILMAAASVDSFWIDKSWLVTMGAWRFYFAGLAVLWHWPKGNQQFHQGMMVAVTLLLLFWVLDALYQYGVGHDVFGIESYQGRLSGVFGMNVKLGPVLALLLPFALVCLKAQPVWMRWSAVVLILLVIVLSGTRSAWLMAGFIMLIYGWMQGKGKRMMWFLKSLILLLVASVVLWHVSDDFQQRVNRSAAVFQGDTAGIDYALADRLPIWHAAWEMFKSHPVNGVGPRAFRKAYPEYAASDDVWLAQNTQGLHAHHWVLELMAETGLLGMLLFSVLAYNLIHMVVLQRNDALLWAPVVALLAAFLPVVSLYSIFSSFWSLCLWWVLMMLFVVVRDD